MRHVTRDAFELRAQISVHTACVLPLMRFASSTEARSTTPWADIEDIVEFCQNGGCCFCFLIVFKFDYFDLISNDFFYVLLLN